MSASQIGGFDPLNFLYNGSFDRRGPPFSHQDAPNMGEGEVELSGDVNRDAPVEPSPFESAFASGRHKRARTSTLYKQLVTMSRGSHKKTLGDSSFGNDRGKELRVASVLHLLAAPGVNQKMVATRLGISQQAVSLWKKGGTISRQHLRGLGDIAKDSGLEDLRVYFYQEGGFGDFAEIPVLKDPGEFNSPDRVVAGHLILPGRFSANAATTQCLEVNSPFCGPLAQGDLIIVDGRSNRPESLQGKIAISMDYSRNLLMGIIERDGRRWVLRSSSGSFPPYPIPGSGIEILGRAIAFVQQLR